MESAVETASRRRILRLENVTRTYKTNADDVVAIKNISLTIYRRVAERVRYYTCWAV